MSGDTTLKLTRRMASGDPAAIQEFYEAYFDLMYTEARRCSGADEATSLDLVHDAMLKLLRRIRPLDSAAHLEGWTRCLVRSVVIDHLRKAARRRRRERKSATPEQAAGHQTDHDLSYARMLWVEELLTELDPFSADLIRYRFLRGWTLQRIAAAVGLKVGAVDGRIRRLLQQFREQAENLNYDYE